MRAYGETGSPSDYQEDHLVSLELGGHPTDPRNLWPEPYPRASEVDSDRERAQREGLRRLALPRRRAGAGVGLEAQPGMTRVSSCTWRLRPTRRWARSSCRSPTSTARSTTGSARSGCACSSAATAVRRSAPTPRCCVSSRSPARGPNRAHRPLPRRALVPDRPSLARWLAHAARDRVGLTGLSDHAVSEAIYLRDPDHHGIEIYADRPRELWEGKVGEQMTTLPLDVDDSWRSSTIRRPSRSTACPTARSSATRICASPTSSTIEFYRDVIGFPLMAALRAMAAFHGAGGYHHHIGANIWESAARGRRRPAPRRCGTRRSSCPTRRSATASSRA